MSDQYKVNWYCLNCNRGLITPNQADAHEQAGHSVDVIDVLNPATDEYLTDDKWQ